MEERKELSREKMRVATMEMKLRKRLNKLVSSLPPDVQDEIVLSPSASMRSEDNEESSFISTPSKHKSSLSVLDESMNSQSSQMNVSLSSLASRHLRKAKDNPYYIMGDLRAVVEIHKSYTEMTEELE